MRSPIAFMPNDSLNNAKWEYGMGQLTATGMQVLDILGKAMRQRYVVDHQLISPMFNVSEYVVRSTDYDRTIQSAQSLLLGLFPRGLVLNSSVVPVHVMPKQFDELLLGYENSICGRLAEMRSKKSGAWVQKEKQSEELFLRLAQASGYEKVTLDQLDIIQDPLFCEAAHDFEFIDAFKNFPELVKKTMDLFTWTLREKYVRNIEMSRLTGGNMIGRVISKFQRKAGRKISVPIYPSPGSPRIEDRTESSDLKITHFSAHDTTLLSLLGSMGMYDDSNPPYGSSIVFELLLKDDDYHVRVFYNKGIQSLFQESLVLCQGKDTCTLDEFVAKYRVMVPDNFQQECQAQNTNVLVGVSITIIGTLLLLCWFQRFYTRSLNKRQTAASVNDYSEEVPLQGV